MNSAMVYIMSRHSPNLVQLAILAFLLIGCTREDTPPSPVLGAFHGTGVLVRADVSLIRRGTHALRQSSGVTYYVESSTQNLEEFQNTIVDVVGTSEKNTTPTDAPVIRAETVRKIGSQDSGQHIWNLPRQGLRVVTPSTWKGSIEGDEAVFHLREHDTSTVTLETLSGSTLPQGTTFFVKNYSAVRTEEADALLQDVFIDIDDTIAHIRLSIHGERSEITAIMLEEFAAFVQSITSRRMTPEKGTGAILQTSVGQKVCGGVAGVLCDAGQYCDITNTTLLTGVCKNH